MKHSDLIILGSGPAGYTAALYASRANTETTIITGDVVGGQLTSTNDIENWPGLTKQTSGPALMADLKAQVDACKVDTVNDFIVSVDLSAKPFVLTGRGGEYSCNALIIATGSSPKMLAVPGEEDLFGAGVSTCAVCDGFFYENQNVAVIGGGNTAVEEALYLSDIASTVHLICRGQYLKAEQVMIDRLHDRIREGKVIVYYESSVKEFIGDNTTGLTSIKANIAGVETVVDVAGAFVAIGHTPNSQLFEGVLELHPYGIIKTGFTGGASSTSVHGVFAAGDVKEDHYRQAIVSAGSGCIAALDAVKYLKQ